MTETTSGTKPDGELLRIESAAQMRAMCAEILSDDRAHPIVGLTCRAGESEPALPVTRVRQHIWSNIPIYVIEAPHARATRSLLPDGHGVHSGAARVWWPGVNFESDPQWHPLIYDSTGTYGEDALQQLAAAFELRSPQPVDLSPEQQTVLQERLRVRTEARCRDLERQLHDLQCDYRDLERVTIGTERPEEAPRPVEGDDDAEVTTAGRLGAQDTVKALHLLVVKSWTDTLTGEFDWSHYPLATVTFSEGFVRDLERRRAPLERVAWVCAMVACGKATTLSGIAPRPLLAGSSSKPGSSQQVREDDAKGWRCNLKRNAAGGARIHYWVHPTGRIEFDAFGNREQL